jgi:isoleucyl-tRNA synthetase
MFRELSDRLVYPSLEAEVLAFWREQKIFEQSVSRRDGAVPFTFYEGPPTANGRPGIHHVISRTIKDLVCRYKTMRGYQVHRKAGWDTHGLPVEIEVEKELGIRTKDEILRFGVAAFNQRCRESVWRYKADWDRLTDQMGYWVDLAHPYITFENSYIESVWWALKRFHDAGMIYRGHKIQPYCPRCETPLSSHELSLGYEDVKDPSVYVRMRLREEPETAFLVWTTTPWTLIANVALAVAPTVSYVKVEHNGEQLILAEERLQVLEGPYTVLARMQGQELVGKEYERLFDYHRLDRRAFYVIPADFVTTEDGTGIVHIAPAYGEDDSRVGKAFDLPTLHPVTRSGTFGPEVSDFAGMFVKDADAEIIRLLKERRQLYRKETILHSYPHCWRCKTPLLYYARDSWYISTTRYVQRMMELNRTIEWVPPEVGEGRFGNWLAENKDWALSRDRFWGTPLPIWVCDRCSAERAVGSIEELATGANVPDPLDLHKPFVDAVTFPCPCGGTMKRTPELIDVWFDSGAMPFAQWHYPFEHRELIDAGARYPADFICEGIDQTRGWFYSLHAIGTFLFDQPAYRSVVVNDLILDKDGQKMSKSKGNTVDPFAILARYGADATRWYLVTTSPPWRPTMFDEQGLVDVQRKFFGTLVNTYAFFAMYANIDGFTNAEAEVPRAERPEIDRWILSELHSLLARYRTAMDAYDVTRAARALSEFTIDQLSNWYVRRNRRRFWKSEPGPDKTAAYQTLYECLVVVSKMLAPFAPFLAETLFRNLNGATGRESEESVHLTLLPESNAGAIDTALEHRMQRAERIVMLVRAMRMRANLKVRQPLRRMIIPVAGDRERDAIERVREIILDEVNVKALEYVTDDSGLVRRRARANFKSLGPKLGSSAQKVAAHLKELPEAELRRLEREGSLRVEFDDVACTLTPEDVEIVREDVAGWVVETDGSLTVALDTRLDEALVAEGNAREFVNRVQNLRKDAGFELTDRIVIFYSAAPSVASQLERMKAYITQETLAVEFRSAEAAATHRVAFEIAGEPITVAIERRP